MTPETKDLPNEAWLAEVGSFVGVAVDELFIEGFEFDPENDIHKIIVRENFRWWKNCLYIVCFGSGPQPILSIRGYPWAYGARIERISNLKARVWGIQLKEEYEQ